MPDQEKDVGEKPRNPRKKTRQPHLSHGYYSIRASHRRKRSSATITERSFVCLANDLVGNYRSDVAALLDGNRCKPGKGLSFMQDIGIIADDKDVWMPAYAQVPRYLNTASAIQLSVKPLTGKRASNACHPNDGLRIKMFACNHDPMLIDSLHRGIRSHFHTQLGECGTEIGRASCRERV